MPVFDLSAIHHFMKILVSGFEPFAGLRDNPTRRLVGDLASLNRPDMDVRAAVLPVTFSAAWDALAREIASFTPDIVIATGLARKSAKIRLEKIALNIIDAPYPDNAGNQPRNQPVIQGGSAAIFSGLPLEQINRQIQAAGLECEVSGSAGTYVCNYVFYRLMHLAQQEQFMAGFIHVPATPDLLLVDEPVMEYAKLIAALSIAMHESLVRRTQAEAGIRV